MCCSIIVATILESFRVTETYGPACYRGDPFKDSNVSSCPPDLYEYYFPFSSRCEYPPMMSTRLGIGWQVSDLYRTLSFT